MKKLAFIVITFIIFATSSCVSRIDIPEEDDAMLYINLEMLRSQDVLYADFRTTNTLNGTYPITYPSNAIIRVFQLAGNGGVTESELSFVYDEAVGRYSSGGGSASFIKPGHRYKLEASLADSDLERITAYSKAPFHILLDSAELLSQEVVIDNDQSFWQGRLRLNFSEALNFESRFAQIDLSGFKTIKEELPGGEIKYTPSGQEQHFQLIDVISGNSAITDLIHKEGFVVEFDELDEAMIEVIIRSPFAIDEPNQVIDMIMSRVTSVTKEHFDYHVSLHNYKSSQGNIFEESALYRSNIEKGLGIFSSCVATTSTIDLR